METEKKCKEKNKGIAVTQIGRGKQSMKKHPPC